MSDENQSSGSSGLSPESLTKMIERLGLPTILIVAASYVGYNEIISPISIKYAEMLDSVTESNRTLTEITSDLRAKITEIGVKNGEVLGKLYEANGKSLEDFNAFKRYLDERLDKIDSVQEDIMKKIDGRVQNERTD